MTPELRDTAMDLAATLAAERVAEILGCDRTEALQALLSSSVGEALYDDDLKLWWESPADIADVFLNENET